MNNVRFTIIILPWGEEGELIFALKWRKIAPLHDNISLPSWSICMRVVIYLLFFLFLGGGEGARGGDCSTASQLLAQCKQPHRLS